MIPELAMLLVAGLVVSGGLIVLITSSTRRRERELAEAQREPIVAPCPPGPQLPPQRQQPVLPLERRAGASQTEGRAVVASAPLLGAQDAQKPATSSALRPVTLDECWVAPGTSTSFGSWGIDGGMIFALRNRSSRATADEASLLDPGLPVAPRGTRDSNAEMPYWPRYAQISPGARAEYLTWLAGGRSDASVQIGCVFLFFYGLERRAMLDAPSSRVARAEIPAIVAELDRLLEVYDNSSFRGYASRLRAVAAALYVDGESGVIAPAMDEPPPYDGFEVRRLDASLGLGRLVRDAKPIDASWALSWYLATELGLRTPARRCWQEFQALFGERYAAEYGDGMLLKPNRSRLRIDYRPANPSLAGATSDIAVPGGELPDVMRLSRPVRDIARLVSACTDELDAYSRWLGRNDAGASPLRALAMLPPTLVARQGGAVVRELTSALDHAVGLAPHARIPADELFKHWPPDKGNKMSKKDATLFVQLLDRLGYGIEPDVRFGGPVLEQGSIAVVFRAAATTPALPSASYQSAAVLLHLAAAVADADGDIAETEREALEAQLLAIKALAPSERTRLAAHVQWLLASGASLRGIQKRLETIEPHARREIAKFAVAVAGADGRVDRKEVKTLEKVYSSLALPKDALFVDLHEMTSSSTPAATEPVVVRSAKASDGFRLPPAPTPTNEQDDGVRLDMSRVRAKLAETAAVSELLAGIFVDADAGATPDGDDADADAIDEASPTLPEPGVLDASHAALLQALATKSSWSAAEIDALAASHGLLPDSALDAINEAALDRCEELALEGTDPVDINIQIARELLR